MAPVVRRVPLIGLVVMAGSLAIPWTAYREAPLPPRWAVLEALRERGWGVALALALVAAGAALVLRPAALAIASATVGLLAAVQTALTVPQPMYNAMGRDKNGQFWEVMDFAAPTHAAWLFVLGAALVLLGLLLRRRTSDAPAPPPSPAPAPPPG